MNYKGLLCRNMNMKNDFKSFKVKGKIASALWMPIASIGVICLTLYALFAWSVKGTFAPSLIYELVLSVAILLVLQLCTPSAYGTSGKAPTV